MTRIDFKDSTLKKLFALSGNQCAFPGCTDRLVNDRGDLIADICHIKAASEGGERFDPKQTDKERREFDNLLVLCPNHHRTTDNVEAYPVDALHRMKREHEAQFKYKPFALTDEQLAKLRRQLSGIAVSKL